MEISELKNRALAVVERGLETLHNNGVTEAVEIDYLAIFSQSEREFEDMLAAVQTMGEEVDKENAKTGKTFLLTRPFQTKAGLLEYLKIRRPDPVRPQMGAPDFRTKDYLTFKDTFIRKSGNFTLMLRKGYEMVEVKGIGVYVYIPSKTIKQRLQSAES